jgi:gliding motility-associated-like protein
MLKKYLLILLSLFSFTELIAQVFTYQNTQTPSQLVTNVLTGAGVVATNITFNGSPLNANTVQTSARSFSATGFPFTNGVYLRTNGAASVASDLDLQAIASGNPTNGAILEFDFVATGNDLSFNYVFASSEYSGYTCSGFNDAFGFFLSGPGITGPYTNSAINLAVVPNTTIPVTINTVNSGTPSGGNPGPCAALDPNWQANSVYFTTANGTFSAEGYNGSTVSLPAVSGLQCGETYHIKLAVCNVLDQILNSGVYLEGGSFTTNPVDFTFNTFTLDNTIYEGCNQLGTLMFTRQGCGNENDTLIAYTSFSGIAGNGTDYQPLGDSVVLLPGVDTVYWQIIPFEDGLVEGNENVNITVMSILANGDTVYSTGVFYISDVPNINLQGQDVNYYCLQDQTSISATVSGGFTPYDVLWENGATTLTTQVPIDGNGVDYYTVTITDACGYVATDSVIVTMNQTLAVDTMIAGPATCEPTGYVSGMVTGQTGVPSYQWSGPGPNNPNFIDASVWQNLSSGWYYFTVFDDVCEVYDSVFVDILNPPMAQFTATPSSGCAPLTVNLVNSSQNALNYIWDFGNGQNANVTTTANQVQIFNNSAVVRLIAAQGNCADTAYQTVTVNICGCMDPDATNYNPLANFDDGSCTYPIPLVEAPNVFTPNGDDANDLFYLTTQNATSIELTILNRWGNVVYNKEGMNPAWDGKSQGGALAEEGVYFYKYVVKGFNDQEVEGHGFLHLVRK